MNLDLLTADAAQFRQAIEDMQYKFYRTVRAAKPDKPLSYFEALYPAEQVRQFERRYVSESK
jgi:hypothetical protein